MHRTIRTFKATIVEARFTSLIVSLLVVAVRYGLFAKHKISESALPDTDYLWQFISPFFRNPQVSFASSTASVFIIAWLLSHINNRFSLIRTRTNLPFIVSLIFFSLHPYFLAMSADYIAIILLLYGFIPLLQSYQQENAQIYALYSSILIGIASLFQIFALVLLPLWWRGEFSMRGGHFKSFLASVFGVLLVFWSVFTLYFFFDNTEGFVAPFLNFTDISILQIPQFSPLKWVGIGAGFALTILFMIFSMRTYIRDKVITLVTIQFVVFILIFFLILQAVYWSKTLFFLSFGLALLSYLVAYFYTMTANKFHIYGAYFIFALLVAFYFINYFSLLLLF